MNETEPLAALAQLEPRGWLVGGAVRDRLLGRSSTDFDVVLAGDPRSLARTLARATGGHPFNLSQRFSAWRVLARDRSWQVDVMPLAGESIEQDLARRDFTINAIAAPLDGGERVDPFGGIEDLSSRRLRMVSDCAFSDDPLRTLRLARHACELDLQAEARTIALARECVGGLDQVASERVFGELKRIVVADGALEGLALMDSLGATSVVMPEWSHLRGVEQSSYHHLDVAEHTRAVLGETITLARDPGRWLGEHAAAVSSLLAEPLADELTRGQALRFGALFHDVAKPSTRELGPEGRVTFIGHDAAGSEMAAAALTRLRASERLSAHVAALTRHHLRLGFLVHEMPLSRRAIYRYLQSCEPVQVDVTLLSIADRLATRGRGSEQAIARHLELAQLLLAEALAWRAQRPRAPVGGHQLTRELGIEPGPQLGRILAELEEASFAGEISSSGEALERARQLLADPVGLDR